MSENIEEAGIRILTEGELIPRVVEKHRRFLEEYRKEFEELESKLNRFEEDTKKMPGSPEPGWQSEKKS
ncbi:hypothetical protein [Methanosarcina horonobensis]|uniref:hypothetical protein n=1 Tax=Methanosarcina horonobensis TaxID=418008 RepID=UPI000A67E594|nr:hypothetical protein [Methanosarcina horonobensis]